MADLCPWRELYRCDDLVQARAVATSIAAMEFDVRLHAPLAKSVDDEPGEDVVEFNCPGPYVIEVPEEHWPDLAEVLRDIIAEQAEFDERIELRRYRHQRKLVVVLAVAGIADALILWRLLDS